MGRRQDKTIKEGRMKWQCAWERESTLPGNVSDGEAVTLDASFNEGIGDFLVELLQYFRERPTDSRTRSNVFSHFQTLSGVCVCVCCCCTRGRAHLRITPTTTALYLPSRTTTRSGERSAKVFQFRGTCHSPSFSSVLRISKGFWPVWALSLFGTRSRLLLK